MELEPAPTASLAALEEALRARGLAPRGAFHPAPGDDVPELADGAAPGTVLLAGQVGEGTWSVFARERRDEPDPLDRWSARALHAVAARFGAAVVLPGDGPPFAPFQRWARRAEPLHPSPLGLAIHPQWGLWHAWRGALLLRARLPLDDRTPGHEGAGGGSPCASCVEQPCLSSCPVGAISSGGSALHGSASGDSGFDVDACVAHVTSPAGIECRTRGCLARRACPVGRAHAYPEAQQRFHMEAFLRQARLRSPR